MKEFPNLNRRQFIIQSFLTMLTHACSVRDTPLTTENVEVLPTPIKTPTPREVSFDSELDGQEFSEKELELFAKIAEIYNKLDYTLPPIEDIHLYYTYGVSADNSWKTDKVVELSNQFSTDQVQTLISYYEHLLGDSLDSTVKCIDFQPNPGGTYIGQNMFSINSSNENNFLNEVLPHELSHLLSFHGINDFYSFLEIMHSKAKMLEHINQSSQYGTLWKFYTEYYISDSNQRSAIQVLSQNMQDYTQRMNEDNPLYYDPFVIFLRNKIDQYPTNFTELDYISLTNDILEARQSHTFPTLYEGMYRSAFNFMSEEVFATAVGKVVAQRGDPPSLDSERQQLTLELFKIGNPQLISFDDLSLEFAFQSNPEGKNRLQVRYVSTCLP